MRHYLENKKYIKALSANLLMIWTLNGCATANHERPNNEIETPKKIDAKTCDPATPISGFGGMVAGGIGHVLDKKTGGGDAFEHSLGKATEEAIRNCKKENDTSLSL